MSLGGSALGGCYGNDDFVEVEPYLNVPLALPLSQNLNHSGVESNNLSLTWWPRKAVKVVVESVKAGINLIDAAPWYGHGKVLAIVLACILVSPYPLSCPYLFIFLVSSYPLSFPYLVHIFSSLFHLCFIVVSIQVENN